MKQAIDIPGTVLGPKYHNATVATIRMMCEFEPHGRASETWEWVWEIVLDNQQAHWKSTNGLRPCKNGVVQSFRGRTIDEVIQKANTFLSEVSWHENVIGEP